MATCLPRIPSCNRLNAVVATGRRYVAVLALIAPLAGVRAQQVCLEPAVAPSPAGTGCVRASMPTRHMSAELRLEPGYATVGQQARRLHAAAARPSLDLVGAERTFEVRNLRNTQRWDVVTFRLLSASEATAVWGALPALDTYGAAAVTAIADSLLGYADDHGGPLASSLSDRDFALPHEGALATVRRLFGPAPNVDGDGRLDVLLLDIADEFESTGGYVAGFFDPNDLTERPHSNGRDVLYIDLAPTVFYRDQVRVAEAGAVK